MTTYAYIRTSTEDQSATPAEQERSIRQAFTVDEVILEESPGTHVHRPALDALIARLGPGDLVAVHRIDRLARGPEVSEPVLRLIWSKGATADSVDERGALTDSTFGYQQRGITGVMAGAETKRSAERQQEGKRAKARRGEALPWGRLPYGLRLDPDITKQDFDRGVRRYIETPQADIVRRIFDEWVAGKGITAIAADLNLDGIPSPNAGGKWKGGTVSGRWSKQSLYPILRNPAYIGIADQGRTRILPKVSPDGALLPGGRRIERHETDDRRAVGALSREVMPTHIIDDDLFAAAAAELDRRTGKRRSRVSKAGHPFTGLVKCGSCGSSLAWRRRGSDTSDRFGRLMCERGWGKDATCDAPARCDEEALLIAVVQQAGTIAAAPGTDRGKSQDEILAAKRKVVALETKLDRLRELYLDGDFDRSEYQERRDALHAELRDATAAIDTAGEPPVVTDAFRDLILVSPISDGETELPHDGWPIWTVTSDGALIPERLTDGMPVIAMPTGEGLRGWLRRVIDRIEVSGNTPKGTDPVSTIQWR